MDEGTDMLQDVALEFFAAAQWAHEVDDASTIRAFHEGETLTFPVYVQAHDDHQQLVVYGVLPGSVDPEHRLDVGAFLAALNYGLSIGNFELDLDDGEVRFRSGIDVEGGELTVAMVRSLAASCVVNVDLYAPAIAAVGTGAMSPAEALDDVGR